MLQIKDLRAGYKRTEVLHGLTLAVDKATIVAVVGANGAGKSTLINSISRVVSTFDGCIVFDGVDITRLSAAEVVDLGIIQVPEGRQLFGPLTVLENLTLGFHRLRRLGAGRAAFKQKLEYVFHLFPRLKERMHQRVVTLSGGEQQMVAMGRALMADPNLLLLDEPSLGLAPLMVEQVFDVLTALRCEGLTMLLVEQHADEALALSDYGYVMATGRVTFEGVSKTLRTEAAIMNSYLGHTAVM